GLLHRGDEFLAFFNVSVVVPAQLVAELPVLDLVRLGVAVGRAPGAPGGVFRPVAILDQVRRAGGPVGEAHADQRLGPDKLAELAEFADADVIGVDPPPVRVRERDAAVAVADARLPAVGAGVDRAAPPADHRRPRRLDRV